MDNPFAWVMNSTQFAGQTGMGGLFQPPQISNAPGIYYNGKSLNWRTWGPETHLASGWTFAEDPAVGIAQSQFNTSNVNPKVDQGDGSGLTLKSSGDPKKDAAWQWAIDQAKSSGIMGQPGGVNLGALPSQQEINYYAQTGSPMPSSMTTYKQEPGADARSGGAMGTWGDLAPWALGATAPFAAPLLGLAGTGGEVGAAASDASSVAGGVNDISSLGGAPWEGASMNLPASGATGTGMTASDVAGGISGSGSLGDVSWAGGGTAADAGGGWWGSLTPMQQLQFGGMGISAITGLGGALAAGKAASQQYNAANLATQAQLGMFNTINAQGAPFRTAAMGALPPLAAGIGAGPPAGGVDTGYFTHQFNANDLNANLAPNYAFMLNQGQMAAKNALNLSGGIGGNFAQGLEQFTQDYAKNAYQNAFANYTANQSNIFNRLSTIAGYGPTSNAITGAAGAGISPGIAQSTLGAGQAQAAGTVGIANALTGGATNAASWYALPQILKAGGIYA